MQTFNLNGDEWDGTRDREGWRVKGVLVGQRIGGELIGATMSEVEPGNKLWPYHTHYLNEEWVIVLRGEPTLRTPEGEQVLKEGDVVCFPRGKEGAHQIINRTELAGSRTDALLDDPRRDHRVPRHRKGSRQGRRGRRHHVREARTHGRVLGRRGLASGGGDRPRSGDSLRREVIPGARECGNVVQPLPQEAREWPLSTQGGAGE